MGIPIGISIGYVITVLISVSLGDGLYHPVVEELEKSCRSEVNAVVVQTIFCGIMGFGISVGTIIWEVEHWSLMKQTILHFLLTSLCILPIAYFMHWMTHSISGVLSYFGIFFGFYIIIWLAQYLSLKKKVKAMNHKI